KPRLHVADEREPLVLARDARHVAVDEHQCEVLRVIAAELVQPPEHRPNAIERRERREIGAAGASRIAQQAESLFGELEEDVVLAREVAVDSRRAVLDPLGNLTNRYVGVALADEE